MISTPAYDLYVKYIEYQLIILEANDLEKDPLIQGFEDEMELALNSMIRSAEISEFAQTSKATDSGSKREFMEALYFIQEEANKLPRLRNVYNEIYKTILNMNNDKALQYLDYILNQTKSLYSQIKYRLEYYLGGYILLYESLTQEIKEGKYYINYIIGGDVKKLKEIEKGIETLHQLIYYTTIVFGSLANLEYSILPKLEDNPTQFEDEGVGVDLNELVQFDGTNLEFCELVYSLARSQKLVDPISRKPLSQKTLGEYLSKMLGARFRHQDLAQVITKHNYSRLDDEDTFLKQLHKHMMHYYRKQQANE